MSNLFYNKSFKNINFDVSDWNVSNVKIWLVCFMDAVNSKVKDLKNGI